MSRYRFIASWTARGLGHTPPLFRLMRVRSSVKASWICRQKSSSCATSSAERPAGDDIRASDAGQRISPAHRDERSARRRLEERAARGEWHVADCSAGDRSRRTAVGRAIRADHGPCDCRRLRPSRSDGAGPPNPAVRCCCRSRRAGRSTDPCCRGHLPTTSRSEGSWMPGATPSDRSSWPSRDRPYACRPTVW